MKSLKNILKASLARDAFEVIYWGDPTAQNYREAVTIFQAADPQSKRAIIDRALRKLQKQKQSHIGLAILHLLDCLIEAGARVELSQQVPAIDLSECGSRKQEVADKSLFEMYWKYLRWQSLKPSWLLVNQTQVDSKLVRYCELAEESISSIIQLDFLLLHCLQDSHHKPLTKLIVDSMLKQMRHDLGVLKTFVEENCKLILQDHELKFHINRIYERTIFIGKQAGRLKMLCSRAGLSPDLPVFKMDAQINKAIEMEMNKNDQGRRQFASEQLIRASPSFEEEASSENSILLENDER